MSDFLPNTSFNVGYVNGYFSSSSRVHHEEIPGAL